MIFVTAQAPSTLPVINTPITVRDASGRSATLSTRGLSVRDSRDRERGFYGVDTDGRPSVDLSDSNGTLRESMYLINDLPTLRQFDNVGKRRAEMRLDTSNDGEILLSDQSEKLKMALFRTTSGDPQLALYGSDGKIRAYFSTDDQSPYFVMRDSAATTCVYIGGYKDGKIGMDVRDAVNKTLWKTP